MSNETSKEMTAEAYLARLEKLGPKLGAVVTVTRDLALKEARAADAEIRAGRYREQAQFHPAQRGLTRPGEVFEKVLIAEDHVAVVDEIGAEGERADHAYGSPG